MSTNEISASLVMKLRGMTGAGMMDCKKYLVKTNGDLEQAVLEMRKADQSKAYKKADRIAAEGTVVVAMTPDSRQAMMLEANCETDFVARDSNFIGFAEQATQAGLKAADASDVNSLGNEKIDGQHTVEEARQQLVVKIGENIQIRRFVKMKTEGVLGHYIHGSKIGVLVNLKGGNEALAKDLAMHIAASKPMVISQDQVPAEAIATEREVFAAQAKESGKPQEIIEKMIDGRINKYLEEVCLTGQPFVKDPNKRVSQLLKENNAEVLEFVRFEVGEGIEKKEDNFVEEVMAQVREKQ